MVITKGSFKNGRSSVGRIEISARQAIAGVYSSPPTSPVATGLNVLVKDVNPRVRYGRADRNRVRNESPARMIVGAR